MVDPTLAFLREAAGPSSFVTKEASPAVLIPSVVAPSSVVAGRG